MPKGNPQTEKLLATLADVAIDEMLAARSSPAPARRRSVRQPLPDFNDDMGARLTPEEQAALDGELDLSDAGEPEEQAAASPFSAYAAELDPLDLSAEMPTDEELEALLREEPEPAGPFASTPHPRPAHPRSAHPPFGDFPADAVAALAAELDEDVNPHHSHSRRPARPAEPVVGVWQSELIDDADDDSDTIQAEGALEARGTVNLSEPPAEHLETATTAIVVRGRVVNIRVAPPPLPDLRPRWWMMPLVWLNAPFNAAPQSAAATAAKAAVLALLNATAVAVYALVIRGWKPF